MANQRVLGLFEGFGIELEYMIVDARSLDVKPSADALMQVVGGGYDLEVDRGAALWSNELALHVIELKTNGPARTLQGLPAVFAEQIRDILDLLAPLGAKLLPTAMHPWMDPERELVLWPHEDAQIYSTFDRIFGCRGHGWANLQSMHINLPFSSDEEFGRLHAAIRLVLPLIPGLSASSPVVDGRVTGTLDNRLDMYRSNCRRVPSVTGLVVPEAVFSEQAYEEQILERIYRDMAPLDRRGVLAHEWVNARGAIARFDRRAIEIRTIDLQECPLADLAIAELVVAAVRALVSQRYMDYSAQQRFDTRELAEFHQLSVVDAGEAGWPRGNYLSAFGLSDDALSVAEVWQSIAERELERGAEHEERDRALGVLLEQGCLSRRILRALGDDPSRARLAAVYQRLAECLASQQMFEPHGA